MLLLTCKPACGPADQELVHTEDDNPTEQQLRRYLERQPKSENPRRKVCEEAFRKAVCAGIGHD